MKVFEAPYFKGTLIETFGLTATNNNSVTLPQTDKGYAIRLNGSNQSISYTGSVSVKSVIIFLKANGLSKDIIDFDGGTHSIEVGASNITATGFVSPTFYVDTVATAALPNNLWKCVIVTTATAFTANAIKIGRETSYFKGDIAYVAFDNAVITASEINDYQKMFMSFRQCGRSKQNFLIPKVTDSSQWKNSGLVAHYNMVPSGSTLVDISGNGNNMTLTGSPQPTNNGIRFDGVNDKGSCTGSSGLDSNVTFCCRFKLWGWGNTTNGRLFASGGILMFSGPTGIIGFSRNTITSASTAASSVALNQWYSLVVTSNSSGVSNIYLDGVLSGSANQASGTPVSSTAWLLGSNSDFTRALQGEIQDLRIYNRVLTTREIKNYHNSFAKTPYYLNDFSDEAVGTAVPIGMIKGTGTYTISELTSDVASGTLRLPKGKKYLKCSVAGTIAFPSNMAYGTWEFSVYKGSDINEMSIWFINGNRNVYPNTLSSYETSIPNNEKIAFGKYTTGGAGLDLLSTVSSYVQNTTWYRIRITRTKAGSFTLLIKGGAFTPTAGYDGWTLVSTAGGSGTNPVTDTTYSTSKFTVLDLDANDCITDIIYTPEIYQP